MIKSSHFRIIVKVIGAIITALVILMFVPKIVMSIIDNGLGLFTETATAFVSWKTPMPFFILYLLFYVTTMWKPLVGSVLVMGPSMFYVIMAGFDGPPILATPTFLAGLLYFLLWLTDRNKQNTSLKNIQL